MANLRKWVRYAFRIFFGCFLLVAILLFIAGLVFMIPSVQTRSAQKAAAYLSEELQTEISIEKLRVYWNLDIRADGFCINDRHHQPMLAATSLSTHFPSVNRHRRLVSIPEIRGDSVWVYIAQYKGEEGNNMKFFFDYFSSDKEKKPMTLYFNGIQLKRSNFIFLHERKYEEDVPGYWNYRHIRISGIDADIRSLEIAGGECRMDLARVDAREQSGFSIRDFSSKATFSKQKLYFENTVFDAGNGSHIDVDFRFDFSSWEAYSEFEDSVYFRCKLRPSHLHLADIHYFSPNLHGWDNPTAVELQGNVTNSLSRLEITRCSLAVNDSCRIRGELLTQNIQNGRDARWDVEIDEASGRIWDLEGFLLPNGNALHLPEILKNCRLHHAMLDFHGYFDHFDAEAEAASNLGDIQLKGNYSASSAYHAQLHTQHLDLKNLLHTPALGHLSAKAEINGRGKEIEEYRVDIERLNLNGQDVRHASVSGDLDDGRLGIQLLSTDPELQADLKGFIDFKEEKTYYAVGEIGRFNLSAFHLLKDSSPVGLAFETKIDLTQNAKGELTGQLQTSRATLSREGRSAHIPLMRVFLDQLPDGKQSLKLQSRPLEAGMEGNVPLKDIPGCLLHFVQDYLPHCAYARPRSILDSASLRIDVAVNRQMEILEELLPQLRIAPGSEAHLLFDHVADDFSLNAKAPRLQYNNLTFGNCTLQSLHDGKLLNLNARCGRLAWNPQDSLSDLQDITLQSDCFRDTMAFQLQAEACGRTESKPVDVKGMLHFGTFYRAVLQLQKGELCLRDKPFRIDPENRIVFGKNSVEFQHVKFAMDQQYFAVNGTYTTDEQTRMNISVHELDLLELESLLQAYGLSLGGIATGDFYLSRRQNAIQFATKLDVDSLVFNEVEFGNLNGKARWAEDLRRVEMQAQLYPLEGQLPAIQLNGYYRPEDKSLNLDGDVQTIDLHVLTPYLTSFSHYVEGTASARLKVSGPVSRPEIRGKLNFTDAYLGIDYIKTIYHLRNQEVEIKDTSFRLKDVQFTDAQGNPGTLNGCIRQLRFRDWWVDLDIAAQNTMVLNTEYKDNDLFYGKAFGTGNIRVRLRPDGDLFIGGDVFTEKPTYISILLNKTASVQQQQSFIQFEKPYSLESDEPAEENTPASSSQTRLLLNINVTPDATVKVMLDPSIGGTIVGQGSGSLRLDLQPEKPFEIYGTYTLSDGSVDLALGNIFTRTLKIENGSSLSWDGRPDKGLMNVHALYTTKTSITNLLGESAITSSYRSVPVTTALNLKGELLNPDFGFDIRLNEVDESIRSLAYNALDTTDKDEMFRQAFSLMLFGRFDVQSANSENANTYNLGYSLSELLSHYIQKMMSTLTDNVNLGFLYRQGDGVTAGNEYNVQFSTNLMENRLTIQSSLDIYGENSELREEQAVAGNVVGDIIAEYKITKDGSLRVKAFNMANYYDVLSAVYSDVPYYQGIGIAVTKDFNTLKDLFRRRKK